MSKSTDQLLTDYVKNIEIPATIKRHINMARYDLYYGPVPAGDCPDNDEYIYPGFEEACKQINEWIDKEDLIRDIWINDETEDIITSKPDGGQYIENPDTGESEWFEDFGIWWHYERNDILREILGKELPKYL